MALRFSLLILVGMLGFATQADAQLYQAQTSTTLNVRQGPGTQYAVIGTIPGGQIVIVDGCATGYAWCHIRYNALQGWASARYLRDPQRGAPVADIGQQLGLALLQLFLSQVPRPGGPSGPPIPANQVCFYEHANFGGAGFCAGRGNQDADLRPSWNDRISSIRVGPYSGGVYVCRDIFFQGRCDFYNGDVASLSGSRNDAISSYRVGQAVGPGPGPYPPPPPAGQACFYQDRSFGGARFCREAGDQSATLSASWNDRISSIRIDPRVWVQVCTDFNYAGQCYSIGYSVPQLSGILIDSISSYRIFAR